MKPNIFVFDVESTSLHGTGFAVGAVVQNCGGTEVDRFELLSREGMGFASTWVRQEVIPYLQGMPQCQTDKELRSKFYEFYIKHKSTAEIWADCAFPVETNFLQSVFMDDPQGRIYQMPYPLKDISTLVDVDIDRAAEFNHPGLRKHNPLDDARASAYCLLKALAQ